MAAHLHNAAVLNVKTMAGQHGVERVLTRECTGDATRLRVATTQYLEQRGVFMNGEPTLATTTTNMYVHRTAQSEGRRRRRNWRERAEYELRAEARNVRNDLAQR